MLKASPLKFSDLLLSVTKSKCRTYDDNLGLKIKKAEVCNTGGVKYVQKISSTGIDPRFVRNRKKILGLC